MSKREVEIDVSTEEINELTAMGFWRLGDDDVLELTHSGNQWVLEWCKKKIAEGLGDGA
jgi:hypothetical protein